MKNKFKILLIFCILMTSCNKVDKNVENRSEANKLGNHILADAKMDLYEHLSDVEKETEYIVVGKKIKQNKSFLQKDNKGIVTGVYTISQFKIEEVKKGNFKVGDILDVFESAGIDEETGKIYHIAGYDFMNMNTDYLLFLRHSQTDPWYMISGLKYGKISLEESKGELRLQLEKSNQVKGMFDDEDRIREEAIKKYINK